MLVSKILTGALSSGQTEITFTDSELRYSLIRIYCDRENVYPTERSLSNNSLQLKYEPQPVDLHIAVELIKEGIEIVDDLLSDDSNKVLSAKQGKELKTLIDNIVVPDVGKLVYSTDEQEVGTWIDGKKIYQISYVTTSAVSLSTSWSSYLFNIEDTAERIIKVELSRYTGSNYGYYPVGCDYSSANGFRFDSYARITCQAGSVFTVFYTKRDIE